MSDTLFRVVVYDKQAQPGRLTLRLVAIMKTMARRHHLGRIAFLQVADLALFSGDVIYSIPVRHLYPHNRDYYLNELGAALPEGDTEIAVAVTDRGHVLLGSY